MKLMFDRIINCIEFEEKKNMFTGCVPLYSQKINLITINVSYCRYHVPFILISLPNGGVIFIFSHWLMEGTRTKAVAMGSFLAHLDIVKLMILRARMI